MMDYRYVAILLACFICICIIDYRTELFIEKSRDTIMPMEAVLPITPHKRSYPNTNETALNVEQCVPHYAYMYEQHMGKTGIRGRYRTTFHLLASHEYSTHIIVTLQSEGKHGTPVFCRYLDANFMELGVPLPTTIIGTSAIHCCRRPNARYITITLNNTEPVNQWTRLNDRTKQEYKYELSLCLAPIYGNDSTWLLLAETIEHYKLQGVQHFYLYIKEMDVYSRYLVEDYLRTGEIEVVWLDYRRDTNKAIRQLISVEDCLDRARFHSKYAIFADLDERITPSLANETLLDVVKSEFGKSNKTAGIRFRPRWVLRDKAVPLVYEVITMWVHWVDLFVPGHQLTDVHPQRAVLRYYRSLSAGNFSHTKIKQDADTFGKYEQTEYPVHLMGRLYENILHRLNHVYSKRLMLGRW